jgi:protein lifeguard
MLTCFFTPQSVLMAALMTALITIALTVYAFTTKTDFTMMGGVLMMCCFGMLGVGLLNIFIQSAFLRTMLCFFGAILMGVYIIFDTQLILGRGKESLSIDDYIFAAMTLYIDIV